MDHSKLLCDVIEIVIKYRIRVMTSSLNTPDWAPGIHQTSKKVRLIMK